VTDERAVAVGCTGAPGQAAGRGHLAGHAGDVRRLFDDKAADWPAKYRPDGPLVDRLNSLLAAVSRYTRPGDCVLDLGCGTGELAFALAATGVRTVGCDISSRMLRRAPRDPACQVGWLLLDPDWRSLPFRPGAFDAVVASSVLEYVDEPAAILRESARVVRPGGAIVCTVPDLRHPIRWLEGIAQSVARVCPGPSGDGSFSRWDSYQAYLRVSRQRHRGRWWLAAAEQAGLRPVPCPAQGRLPPLRLLAFRRPGEQENRP